MVKLFSLAETYQITGTEPARDNYGESSILFRRTLFILEPYELSICA